MAFFKTTNSTNLKTGRNIEPQTLDGGVNKDGTIFNIKVNQAWDSRNTSGKVKGALTVKNDDTNVFGKLTSDTKPIEIIFGMGVGTSYTAGSVSKHVHILVIDPDDVPTKAKIIIMTSPTTANIIEYPDTNYNPTTILPFITNSANYTIYASEFGVYEQHEGTLTAITDAPKTPIMCIDDNRLYMLKYTRLYWCDINNPTNWTTGDAGNALITDMNGFGTALITLNDVVIAFSTTSMCFLYGDDTGNFQQASQSMPHGCVGQWALDKTSDAVFFLDYKALKVYSAGQVLDISQKIGPWIKGMNTNFDFYKNPSIVAVNDNKVYLSIPYGNSTANNMTFEYDIESGNWHIWDYGYSHFLRYGKDFYGTNSPGGIQPSGLNKIGTVETKTTTAWYHELPMKFMGFNKQTISSIPVLFNLPVGSTMKLAYNLNPNTPSWTDLYTFTPSADIQDQLIYVPMSVLNNVDMYQLKLSGTGPCTVYYIGTDGRVKIR